MSRPKGLPDYRNPPLNELVLGSQFAQYQGYTSVDAAGIAALFADEFPIIEEQPARPMGYETFGGTSQGAEFSIGFGPAIQHNRLWFLSQQGDRLLQFEPTGFWANWRRHNDTDTYPRYESIADHYITKHNLLSEHLKQRFEREMIVDQAEITYINIIPVSDFSDAGKWFRILDFPFPSTENLNLVFSEVVKDADNSPIARLHYGLAGVRSVEGDQKAIQLSLTYKGRPDSEDASALRTFLDGGRKEIVNRFTSITKSEAHEFWERQS